MSHSVSVSQAYDESWLYDLNFARLSLRKHFKNCMPVNLGKPVSFDTQKYSFFLSQTAYRSWDIVPCKCLQQLELWEAACIACNCHEKCQKCRVRRDDVLETQTFPDSWHSMSWRSLAFWMKAPAQVLNASSWRYKSDETSLLYFVSFVTWTCKSQSNRVISSTGNKNENRPVMLCGDSNSVRNWIKQVSTTGQQNCHSGAIARSFHSAIAWEFFQKQFLSPDARVLECSFRHAPFGSCTLSCLTNVVEFVPQLTNEINNFLQKCSCCWQINWFWLQLFGDCVNKAQNLFQQYEQNNEFETDVLCNNILW